MEQFTKLIGKNKVSDANLGLTHYEAAPEGDKYYLSYNTNSNDGEKYSFCTLIFSLREAGNEFKIDGVAAENSDDETTLSIGPRNYEELSTIIFTPAISGFGQALARSCCALSVVHHFCGAGSDYLDVGNLRQSRSTRVGSHCSILQYVGSCRGWGKIRLDGACCLLFRRHPLCRIYHKYCLLDNYMYRGS